MGESDRDQELMMNLVVKLVSLPLTKRRRVTAQVDGNAASLVDLSVSGAHVLSPTILKPNRHVRFAFTDAAHPMRCRAVVVWATFEIPKGVARYRAGLELFDADPAAVTRFIDAHKAK